jgi:ribosome-binding protein aMBF1 (putative translation factor)
MKNGRMSPERRKRLEAGGWKVGTVREFLSLTSAEEAFIEIKLALADCLRERRRRLGWTQSQVAQKVESSQARVARMEAGDPEVSADLLLRTLLVLGATRKDLAKIIGSRAA